MHLYKKEKDDCWKEYTGDKRKDEEEGSVLMVIPRWRGNTNLEISYVQ